MSGNSKSQLDYEELAKAIKKIQEESDQLTPEERQYLRDEMDRRKKNKQLFDKVVTSVVGTLAVTGIVWLFKTILFPVLYGVGAFVLDMLKHKGYWN